MSEFLRCGHMRNKRAWAVAYCLGVGIYGDRSAETIRSIASGHVDDLRMRNANCRVANRIAVGTRQ